MRIEQIGSRLKYYSKEIYKDIRRLLLADITMGSVSIDKSRDTIVLFPYTPSLLCCGLAGLIAFHKKDLVREKPDTSLFLSMIDKVREQGFDHCTARNLSLAESYLGGDTLLDAFLEFSNALKTDGIFVELFNSKELTQSVISAAQDLEEIIARETRAFNLNSGLLDSESTDMIAARLEKVKDIRWSLSKEVHQNITRVKNLITGSGERAPDHAVQAFKKINTVLNSIDKLEVRGRDSAGISVMFTLSGDTFEAFMEKLIEESHDNRLKKRAATDILSNNSITIAEHTSPQGEKSVTLSMVYKVAAEIGSLGDNVTFLRDQIRKDRILQLLATLPTLTTTVSAHTRWASVGEISEANCHPLDNEASDSKTAKTGIIHVCLNGDIDNYIALKGRYEKRWDPLPREITTDTKIIPMQIESYLRQGHPIDEAFRLAVNDFEGSHAISMHTSLAPGKLFLAQKGSGQAVFVGIAENHLMPVSEVYGFVEETPRYLKMDGEKTIQGKKGKTQGQIFILAHCKTPDHSDIPAGIRAMYYDGTPVNLSDKDIKHTEITTRDIDRQAFSHYFLKEISESPVSVEKTLHNRWKVRDTKKDLYTTALDESVVPPSLAEALSKGEVKRIFFVGQGTAGVAALACSGILSHYINDPSIQISALKSSEFSGFMMHEDDAPDALKNTLVIAISQSGTTTDTNLTVDMVRERGAHTLAIVNRRDSDLTFKVDGVIYTSSGRDIEMSVASTKAFYSQIVAGAILGLHISGITGSRNDGFISHELKQLLELPGKMKKILQLKERIEASARKYAVTKTYWAAVGSGYNKASADEIRIKLSELCYKTISSDFVEDKKHIDLSSEPLIIICAAGTRESVIGDIIKDTAIFKAHKALPIVIANEGEERFGPYAESVFHVPPVEEHLAPLVNTLAGHIWGYYAALSINDGSRFMYRNREEIQNIIADYSSREMNVYEIVLENKFREKIAEFYKEFRIRRRSGQFPSIIGLNTASDLTLLLKYLSGKLPVSDFELDFGAKGTPANMLKIFFNCLNECINATARPVDAIKHQAKTVTVGTSRISEKVEGLLFDALEAHNIDVSQITASNVLVLKNLQGVIGGIEGSVLYRINGLNLLGEATEETTIEVMTKTGIFESVPSRVETDPTLKGTKSIIVREGNVFIGKGKKDNKNTLIIPVIPSSSSNTIEYILSLNVSFKEGAVPLFAKAKALGGKLERIRNIIQENGTRWDDSHLEILKIDDLFGLSAEKIGEVIIEALDDHWHENPTLQAMK